MGNHQQKIKIAFKCYDPDNLDFITKKEVKYILKHIPLNFEARYGISFGSFDSEAYTSRELMQHQLKVDSDQIDQMVESIFAEYPDGMFLDEFIQFTTQISSEFVYPIFDTMYQCVPCIQNFFKLRHNYLNILYSKGNNMDLQQPEFVTLPPPISSKLQERLVIYN